MIYPKNYFDRIIGENEKKDFLVNAIKFLNAASNPVWKTPIVLSTTDKLYRVYLTQYPNVYFILNTCNINKLGLEIKMCMRAAQRFNIFDLQNILDAAHAIAKTTEAPCVIYKE